MSILALKGEEFDQWLKDGRKEEVEYLEEFYNREHQIEQVIKKIQKNTLRRYKLYKNDKEHITIYGNIKEDILRLLLREGYTFHH